MRDVTPRVDIAFKKIFGVEENDVMNFSDAEREDYEDHLKWRPIQANTMKKYKQDGREEGRAEGELNKAIAIAKNLVNLGLPIQDIINATGLTKEQISTINK